MKIPKIKLFFVLLVLFSAGHVSADIGICTGTCNGPYMELSTISPQNAHPGEVVTLSGIFKGAINLKVYINVPYSGTVMPITPKTVTDDKVTFLVPSNFALGTYRLGVDHDGSCKVSCGSNSLDFVVSEPVPVVDNIKLKGASKEQPLLSGKKAYIYGRGFTKDLTVMLSSGERIDANIISDSKATFIVPTVTSGPVVRFVTLENQYGNKSDGTYRITIEGENNLYKNNSTTTTVQATPNATLTDERRAQIQKQIKELLALIALLLEKQAALR